MAAYKREENSLDAAELEDQEALEEEISRLDVSTQPMIGGEAVKLANLPKSETDQEKVSLAQLFLE